MDILFTSTYMLIPASYHAQKKKLLFYQEDELVFDLTVALDYDQPDYVFPLNVARFRGKTMKLVCEPEAELHFEQTEHPVLDYSGKYRPWAHFTARRGWINDPNGLTFHDGKYLMYFQHNPVATTWENMHWGSAESEDLIHWTEHDDVLFPDRDGTIFSGSAIVDTDNRAGFGKDAVLYFYTCAGSTSNASKDKPFTQRLAYSTDGGRTLRKYEHPLIEHIVGANRDPKVIRYEPDDSYILALYLDEHDFALFKSEDLLHWREIQRLVLPDDAECPDFYPLPVDGSPENVKWVFSAASDRYLIGTFDGTHFEPESEQLRLHYGNGSYAAQSWSGTPGRRIRTAFAGIVIPGMPFGGCLNVPQEMTLKTIRGQVRLCASPVEEIQRLYANTTELADVAVAADRPFRHTIGSKACDLKVSISSDKAWRMSLFGLELQYDPAEETLTCGDKSAPVRKEDDTVTIRVVYDAVYAEIFAESGSVFMGMTYIQDSVLNSLVISSEEARIVSLQVSELNPFFTQEK